MNVNFDFQDYEEFYNISRYMYGLLLHNKPISADDIKSYINGTVDFVKSMYTELVSLQATAKQPSTDTQLTLEQPTPTFNPTKDEWFVINITELKGLYQCNIDGKVRRTPNTIVCGKKVDYLTPLPSDIYCFWINGNNIRIHKNAILQATFNIEPNWKRLDGDFSEYEVSKNKELRYFRTQRLYKARVLKKGAMSYELRSRLWQGQRTLRVDDKLISKVFGGDIDES